MKFSTMKIDDIKESAFNPRISLSKNSREYKDIMDSINEFGCVETLVVNEYNNTCLGGHQRLAVMKDMGYKEVDCVLVYEPDPAREKALCVALNKIKGEFDLELLSKLLADDEVNIFPTGFEEGEIDLDALLPDDDPDFDLEGEPESDDNQEEIEEEPENTATTSTMVKIGRCSFKITSQEYFDLLNKIRDNGIFDKNRIIEEMKRRLLND